MIDRDKLTPNSLWVHQKGGLYLVIGIAQCSTNAAIAGGKTEEGVVYWSFKYKAMRYREVSEFLDGRFQPLAENHFGQPPA